MPPRRRPRRTQASKRKDVAAKPRAAASPPPAFPAVHPTHGGRDIGAVRARNSSATAVPEVYPPDWRERGPRPGDEGFGRYVAELLGRANLARTLTCDFSRPVDQWYQNVLSFLVHPRSPIDRLLVVWQLGAGKTLGMLRVLDNYFTDPRPKVLVFPTDQLVQNFYQELLQKPNRHATWLSETHGVRWPPPGAGRAAQAAAVGQARDLLERTPRAGSGRGPLRAFRYTRAGGQGLRDWAGLRHGPGAAERLRAEEHTLSHCVVLCDEWDLTKGAREVPLKSGFNGVVISDV